MISLMHLKKNIKDISRLKEIITAFAIGGFYYYIKKANLKNCVSLKCRIQCMFKKRCDCPPEQHSLPIHFRKVIEQLGPTFIKFGQLLSLRPDVIPVEYCDELRKLQDKVPGFPFKDAKNIIEKELNQPLTSIFSSFEEQPIAAASIAQVHRARLKNGKHVAVKLLRPKIKEIIEQDIRIMEMIASLLEKHFEASRPFRPKRFVQEFKDWTMKEIDFRNEACVMTEMHENFRNNKLIKIPQVYFKHTTERVLTMEFLEGIRIDDEKGLKKLHINPKQLAINSIRIIVEQTLVHGIFHGDPHPGNILALRGNRFGFLDFGIIGRLSERQKRKISLYLIHLFEHDFDRALRHVIDLAEINEQSDIEGFKRKVFDILGASYGTLERNSLSRALFRTIIVGIDYKVYFPSDLVLLSKAFVTAESVGRQVYPEFSLLIDAKEPVEKTLKQSLSPLKSVKNLIKNSFDYGELIEDIPIHAMRTLKRIEEGKININIDSKEFSDHIKELHESHMVKTMGIIVAALILSSAITSSIQKGPPHMLSLSTIEIYVAIIISILMVLYIKKQR